MKRAAAAERAFFTAAHANADVWQRVLAERRRRYGMERVRTFLTPALLDEEHAEPLARAVEGLRRALLCVQRAWFDDARFRDQLSLPPGVEPLALRTAREGAAVACRFDVALDPARPLAMKVLEVQAGDASGAGWSDRLWDGLSECLSPIATASGWRLRSPSLLEAHRRMTLAALESSLDAGAEPPADPLVAFACARDSFVRSDHEAMAALYRRFGTRAVVVDPRDIEVRAEGLFVAASRADVIVRDTVDELVSEPFLSETARLRAHLAAGETLVLPPFRDALLDDKRALALLSSGAADELLAGDVSALAAVRAHLPWTRVLDEQALPEARAKRERLVLKPADGYGGVGVVVGDSVSEWRWQTALDDALAAGSTRPFVLQERQELPRVRLSPLDDAPAAAPSGDVEERWLCVSLWCHGGRFSGGFARASTDVVVNVHRGGGIVPLAFVG